MHPLVQTALDQLLSSVERKRAKALDASDVSFPFSAVRFPAYVQATVSELDFAHSDLLTAERGKAIRIEWEPGAGHQKRVVRIRAGDFDCLARLVGRVPSWDQVAAAETALQGWAQNPRVASLLMAWRMGRTVRGKGPASLLEWHDAMRVIDYLAAAPASDIPVRRLSAEMFRDSKRIEAIAVSLDYLTASSDLPARDPAQLLAELGLLRFPQPVYLAANRCQVRVSGGAVLPSIAPYCALPPEAVAGIDQPIEYVLTIENLTTFHEATRLCHSVAAVMMYTGGMPSPSFLATYSRILSTAGPAVAVFHWGDPDLGGLRIAAKLYDIAQKSSRTLQLWGMHGLSADLGGRRVLQRSELDAIRAICASRGWDHVSSDIERRGVATEQEQLSMDLPWTTKDLGATD